MKSILVGIWLILVLILAHLTPQFGVLSKTLTFTTVGLSAILISIGFFIEKK